MLNEKPLAHALTKPVCQLDTNGYYRGQTEADLSPLEANDGVYLLPAHTIDTAPPTPKDGHAARWLPESKSWEYVPDHRGRTVYNTADGGATVIDKIGALENGLTEQPRPDEYHEWDGKNWALSKKAQDRQLTDDKAAKRAHAAQQAQAFINAAAGLNNVPDFELATWGIQAAEAQAWAADNSAATPVLTQIAAARGVDVNELRQKALAKAQAFTLLSAHVAGQRQAFEDAINAAKTNDELDAINIAYRAPVQP